MDNPDHVGSQAIMRTDVRVALQYAIDTDAICENLLLTSCRRATSLVNAAQRPSHA